MYVYVVNIISILFYGILMERYDSLLKRRIFIFLSFFQTFLIFSLRNSFIGTDTYQMSLEYSLAHVRSFSEYLYLKAPLYYFLQDIFHLIIPNSQGYMILCGLFIVGGTGIYIYKYSKNIVFSTYLFFSLYFFFFSMNGSRQSIAIVLISIGMMYVCEKKFLETFLLFSSAFLIHSTAIICLPLMFLIFIKRRAIIRLCMFMYVFSILFFEKAMNVFILLFPKYSFYLTTESIYNSGNNRKVLLTIFYFIFFCFALFVYLKTRDKKNKKENFYFETSLFYLLNTIAIGIVALKSIVLTRLEYYFSFQLILFIPFVLSKLNIKEKSFLYFCLWIVLSIPGILQLIWNFGEVCPYKFFWEF